MVSPDVNTIFLTIEVEGVQEAHFARGYAGFVTAVGYLSMRFLYSSSKVQIGTVVMYIVCVMMQFQKYLVLFMTDILQWELQHSLLVSPLH